MEARGKGTVTSLSSLFPAEEAQKAAQLVKDNITEKYKELDNLYSFVNDNTNLINLVHRLPDELHHQIMFSTQFSSWVIRKQPLCVANTRVPFGKAAFFPGRLVHTNEFMVFLGEGYFAERSAKQTVDILKRRGNMLDSEADSLKSVIEDLKNEASFFDKTAEEAAEGLVDIREEYIDDDDDDDGGEEGFEETMSNSVPGQENSNAPNVSVADSATGVIDDQEYACMMARFNELEKEELELEDIEHEVEDKYDEDLNTRDKEHSDARFYGNVFSDVSHPEVAATSNKNSSWLPIRKDESSFKKALPQTLVGKSVVEDVPTVLKTSVQPVSKSKPKQHHLMPQRPPRRGFDVGASMSSQDAGSLMSRQAINSLKAFSGSIVERTVDVPTNPNKETTSQPSKPISRFKMQRKDGQI